MKYAKFFGALCLIACLLFGCAAVGETTAESATAVPNGGWTLDTFEEYLAGQSVKTLDQFQENYQIARTLLASGTLPEGQMQTFIPNNPDPKADRIDPSTGFYRVKLDPEIYGVSQFFILPEGQRKMTANEYLQLAQTAILPGNELVREENSWIPLQNRTTNTSRPLTEKEQFWLLFQANTFMHDVGTGHIQPDVPIVVYTGCGQTPDEMGSFTFYPTKEMSDYAIQSAGFQFFRSLPEEDRKNLRPNGNEIDWKAALAKAKETIAEKTTQPGDTRKFYTRYENSTWTVALCYEDDGSYLVELDAVDGTLLTLQRMPDGFCDYDFLWEENKVPDGTMFFP